MFVKHPLFAQPEDPSAKVWRYMDFTKFVSLMDSKCLFFPRADKFHDPFEGSMPIPNITGRAAFLETIPNPERSITKESITSSWEIGKNWPRYHAINCWHMNDHESAAMWKLYLKSDEGIAIQSRYSKLCESIIYEQPFYVGMVKCIDYDKDFIPPNKLLSPFLYKRKSFEHEREVRILIAKWPITENGLDWKLETMDFGLSVRVDLPRLIERIYIAPGAPTWFVDLMKAVISKYEYEFEVVHSKMDEKALF